MPYKDCECVRVLRDLSGQDLYGETQVSVKAGELATVINVFSDGEYEVEFQDLSSPYGWGVPTLGKPISPHMQKTPSKAFLSANIGRPTGRPSLTQHTAR